MKINPFPENKQVRPDYELQARTWRNFAILLLIISSLIVIQYMRGINSLQGENYRLRVLLSTQAH